MFKHGHSYDDFRAGHRMKEMELIRAQKKGKEGDRKIRKERET